MVCDEFIHPLYYVEIVNLIYNVVKIVQNVGKEKCLSNGNTENILEYEKKRNNLVEKIMVIEMKIFAP